MDDSCVFAHLYFLITFYNQYVIWCDKDKMINSVSPDANLSLPSLQFSYFPLSVNIILIFCSNQERETTLVILIERI